MVFVYWDNSNIYHEAQRLAERAGRHARSTEEAFLFSMLLRIFAGNIGPTAQVPKTGGPWSCSSGWVDRYQQRT